MVQKYFNINREKKKYLTYVKKIYLTYLETSLDGLHGAGAVAGHALEEEETTLLGQDGVGGSGHEYYLLLFRIFDFDIAIPARVTRHVFLDVASQHILNVLLLETTYNNIKMNPCIITVR